MSESNQVLSFRSIATICVTLVILFVSYLVYRGTVKDSIELEQRKVEAKETVEVQEEKSQFWQKLVPWGSDEAEGSEE